MNNKIYKLHKRIMKNDMNAIDEIETLEDAKEIIKMIVSKLFLHTLAYRQMEHIKECF